MVATRGGPDVLVVGADLAGLACARDLTGAGLGVRVMEASDGVGGRMRSDRHEGFVIDRGFQVFNTSYPQVRRRLALRALRLRPFTPGVLVHTDDGPLRFSDPTRGPRRLGDLRPGRLAGSRDLAALGVLSARDMLAPARSVKHGDDRTTRTAPAAGGAMCAGTTAPPAPSRGPWPRGPARPVRWPGTWRHSHLWAARRVRRRSGRRPSGTWGAWRTRSRSGWGARGRRAGTRGRSPGRRSRSRATSAWRTG